MKKFILLIFLSSVLFNSCQKSNDLASIENCPVEKQTSKINGGSILEFQAFEYGNKNATKIVEKTGVNSVAISPVMTIKHDCNFQRCRPYQFDTQKEILLLQNMLPKIINSNVDHILLKPLTAFTNSTDDFWGDFYANSEEEWKEIEMTYRDLILSVAKLSNEYPQIQILSIGNELREFTKRRPEFFKKLIQELRSSYPNLKLTYAANWDEYNQTKFWNDLDYIGVNAYFPLLNKASPTSAEIKTALNPIKLSLQNFSCRHNKPILFTEYGFRSIDFAAWKAWELEELSVSNINYEVQQNGYQAFLETFWNEDWVAGGYYWEWKIPLSDNSNGFDNWWYVNGKPVQQTIKSYYSKKPM